MDSNNTGNNRTIAGAITYPSRNVQNDVPVPVQPRQPRNLQGLLKFAMEATKAEDAPGNSELGPMDDERRKFLEEALKSLTVNVAQALQNSIRVLSNVEVMHSIQVGDDLPEDVQSAFNTLLDFIDDIDIANDFYKLGGFAIFPVCYGSENDSVRALASSVLAELCQNNPFCQSRALEYGLLNVLLNLAQSERRDALIKCLYAISCSTREFEPACRELIAQDGCDTLAQLLRAPEPAARTKAAFLVRYLCSNYSDAREQFIRHNLIGTITEQIKTGHDDTTEHLLGVLMALVEDLDSKVLAQCRDPSIGLRKTLEDHMKALEKEADRYREEMDYCDGILSRVFESCPQVNDLVEEIADR